MLYNIVFRKQNIDKYGYFISIQSSQKNFYDIQEYEYVVYCSCTYQENLRTLQTEKVSQTRGYKLFISNRLTDQ